MREVRRGLFIGDAKDAHLLMSTSSCHGHHVVSHLLSLLFRHGDDADTPDAPLDVDGKAIQRLHVPWMDTEDQNILDDLELCLAFIEEGRKRGGVLVHCLAGVSRSATAVTAYLMRSEQLSLKGALSSLQAVSESACPNVGFLNQLKLFECMGFKVDEGSEIYKRFRVEKLGEAYGQGKKIENSAFAADPSSMASQVLTSSVVIPLYRCKKCRRIVACPDNVLSHNQDDKKSSFKKKQNNAVWDQKEETGCTSVFVEPMQWMTTVQEGGVMGKLSCVACKARLGNFSWAGVQCSCGVWVVPAFQLHKSRIDASRF